MNDYPLVWIMMGVSGAGKTVVGRLLAERLESDFLEGDRRHSRANIRKMVAQMPLQDADRHQWLLEIANAIQQANDRDCEVVITCSALKAAYRSQLTAIGRVQLVWLQVPTAVLEQRLAHRTNHYMQADLLQSQIATFESISPHEAVLTVDGQLAPSAIVDDLLHQATQRFPSLKKSWWQRYVEA